MASSTPRGPMVRNAAASDLSSTFGVSSMASQLPSSITSAPPSSGAPGIQGTNAPAYGTQVRRSAFNIRDCDLQLHVIPFMHVENAVRSISLQGQNSNTSNLAAKGNLVSSHTRSMSLSAMANVDDSSPPVGQANKGAEVNGTSDELGSTDVLGTVMRNFSRISQGLKRGVPGAQSAGDLVSMSTAVPTAPTPYDYCRQLVDRSMKTFASSQSNASSSPHPSGMVGKESNPADSLYPNIYIGDVACVVLTVVPKSSSNFSGSTWQTLSLMSSSAASFRSLEISLVEELRQGQSTDDLFQTGNKASSAVTVGVPASAQSPAAPAVSASPSTIPLWTNPPHTHIVVQEVLFDSGWQTYSMRKNQVASTPRMSDEERRRILTQNAPLRMIWFQVGGCVSASNAFVKNLHISLLHDSALRDLSSTSHHPMVYRSTTSAAISGAQLPSHLIFTKAIRFWSPLSISATCKEISHANWPQILMLVRMTNCRQDRQSVVIESPEFHMASSVIVRLRKSAPALTRSMTQQIIQQAYEIIPVDDMIRHSGTESPPSSDQYTKLYSGEEYTTGYIIRLREHNPQKFSLPIGYSWDTPISVRVTGTSSLAIKSQTYGSSLKPASLSLNSNSHLQNQLLFITRWRIEDTGSFGMQVFVNAPPFVTVGLPFPVHIEIRNYLTKDVDKAVLYFDLSSDIGRTYNTGKTEEEDDPNAVKVSLFTGSSIDPNFLLLVDPLWIPISGLAANGGLIRVQVTAVAHARGVCQLPAISIIEGDVDEPLGQARGGKASGRTSPTLGQGSRKVYGIWQTRSHMEILARHASEVSKTDG